MEAFGWLAHIPWFAWIPIVAIIGSSINAALKAICDHRERMAMIQQGMDPSTLASSNGESGGWCCGENIVADLEHAPANPKARIPEL